MKGFGTVATGTLIGGPLAVGEEVEVLPAGDRARVRGLQRHGETLETMEPGARCALNLQGVEVGQVPRGSVLARPGALPLARVLDARLHWLSDAPRLEKPTPALLLLGTSEHAVRIASVGSAPISAGGTGFVRIHLEHGTLPMLPGDRFIVRGFARTATGGHTLGGGTVLDAAPPHRRLSDPELLRQLEALQGGGPAEALRVRIARAGLAGISRAVLIRETGLEPERVDSELDRLREAGASEATGEGVWVAAGRVLDLSARVLEALARFHAAEPLRPGMPLAALRGALPANATQGAVDRSLAVLAAEGRVLIEGKTVRQAEHAAELGDQDQQIVAALREGTREAGLTPPTLREWCESLDIAEARVRDLLAWLERRGEIVRAGPIAGPLWFDAAAVENLRHRVREHLAREAHLDTPTYKALIGTTRKHAVPLMELLDAEKLTSRRGEVRVPGRASKA